MMVKDELKNCFTVERALTLFKTGKIQKIVYWVFNLLLAWELAFGASWDLLRIQYVQDVMVHLGYPVYILTIIGVWKVGAAIAILIPRFPILKEWAYAGVIFLFTGAADYSGVFDPHIPASISPTLWTVEFDAIKL